MAPDQSSSTPAPLEGRVIVASADELAAVVEFLLGPGGSFFCGSVIFCDGGTDALLRGDAWPAIWEL